MTVSAPEVIVAVSVLELPPSGVLASADVAREAVGALAEAAGGWGLSGQEAVELLGVVGPMLAQLESVSLTATRVVRDSGVWGLDGSRSARAFLERTTGASGAKTGSDLLLAERLATVLPLTAQAFARGCQLR